MNIEQYFSANYPEARARFLQLCETAGFTATATDPAGLLDELTYTWDFGDGSGPGGPGSSVTHVFALAGDYTVQVLPATGHA